jgi:hypothetical protein
MDWIDEEKTRREIEEISTGIVEEYTKLLKPFLQEIVKLNAHIKELEEGIKEILSFIHDVAPEIISRSLKNDLIKLIEKEKP